MRLLPGCRHPLIRDEEMWLQLRDYSATRTRLSHGNPILGHYVRFSPSNDQCTDIPNR
jgi:hypothetical protein